MLQRLAASLARLGVTADDPEPVRVQKATLTLATSTDRLLITGERNGFRPDETASFRLELPAPAAATALTVYLVNVGGDGAEALLGTGEWSVDPAWDTATGFLPAPPIGQHTLREGDSDEPPVSADPAEVGTMLLSGGTTSMSKLIPRTHQDYVLNAKACGEVAGFDENTVFLAILPLGHNYNLASPGLLGALYHGGSVVLVPATDTETVFAAVQRERVTVIAAVVPLIAAWLEAGVERRFDVSSLRVVQNGGARLAPGGRARYCAPRR